MFFEAAVRGTNVGSGLTAALIDVVFHQRNDLLELVLQLSASSRRARVQRAHHLRHTHTDTHIYSLSYQLDDKTDHKTISLRLFALKYSS